MLLGFAALHKPLLLVGAENPEMAADEFRLKTVTPKWGRLILVL